MLPVVAALVLVFAAGCTSSKPNVMPSAPAPTSSSAESLAPARSASAGPSSTVVNSALISSPPHGWVTVRGLYPHEHSPCKHAKQPLLHARYPGTLSIHRSDDGTLAVTVALPFEAYLDGIAEMPPSWPEAALEAQAIAARTYALATTGWDGAQGETLKTPICATSSCQVYDGIPIGNEPHIHRWYRAVRLTSGQVLLFDGHPAQTVYFSTSNGHTYGNEEVFDTAPLPYLRPVVENDDGASPLSHWSVHLPYADLDRFLVQAGEWQGGTAISDIRLEGQTIVVRGGGTLRSMDLSTFRDAVNEWAECLEPGRYPQGGMPTTIPSSSLSVSAGPSSMTVTGRGWGHGVGMVQWGAYGKARRGWSDGQILSYYYGGLRPQRYPEPGLIHVQVASGLTSLRILPSGSGARVDGEAVGPGRITVSGGDELRVRGS